MASVAPTISGPPAHTLGPNRSASSAGSNYMTTTAPDPQENGQISEASKVANAMKARKRTKTGCLTCRKRRIKCGEERPTCKNCTKSKRECEGYIPRVVFREPAGGSGGPAQAPFFATQGYGSSDPATMFGDGSGVSTDGASYPAIAPRPSMERGNTGLGLPAGSESYWVQPDQHTAATYTYVTQPYTTGIIAPPLSNVPPHLINAYPSPDNGIFPNDYGTSTGYHGLRPEVIATTSNIGFENNQIPTNPWPYSPEASEPSITEPSPAHAPIHFTRDDSAGRQQSHNQPSHNPRQAPPYNIGERVLPFPNDLAYQERIARPQETVAQDLVARQFQGQNQPYGYPAASSSWFEEPPDDWFDVESEDEDPRSKSDTSPSDLGMMIAMSAQKNNGNIRSMTNFLNEPNVLAAYEPAYAASPLRDAQTARIFCHFITATGPTLHVCERHPSNPAVIFSGRPVPKSQQSLWSYTLPMMALHHQGLLHAMLAMSSLHIAKLQQSSPTPSLRHYHYALRRVAKALGNQKKRRDPATLAATMLLGFYEVTTAEHNKWNSHLSGARQLVMDIPFAKLTKRAEAYRRRQEEAEANAYQRQNDLGSSHFPSRRVSGSLSSRLERQLDRGLISTIMGWETNYGNSGEVLDPNWSSSDSEEPITLREVEEYEVSLDLFWWYAKQDMYQSVISGNRLLLSYERWVHSPPRAPVGRLDAVYGSMDHLLLLMARLADFSGKDVARKIRAASEAERRAKELRPSPPSSTETSPSHPPPMYGMMPDPGPVRLPQGFDQAQHDQIYNAPPLSESKSLDAAFADAQAEWSDIVHAFDVFYQSLGPSYEALSPEHMTPLSTPFGPAIYYRSYSIACVLCLYYCGRIILARSHPSMPPAAMAAAGVAARHTVTYANTIGRICAGIQPVSNTAPLNPHHGAALMDVCMGLFHAGVQYQDPAQRGWTITKLRDVARLTGWQTSALIASGCERAWMRAAELGRGPPYERTMNTNAKDDRVAGRARDPKFMAGRPKDNNDRRLVNSNAGTRVYWAMGILSVEEDMQELNLG